MGARPAPKPTPNREAELAAIRAALARSVEDVKAGRTYSMEEVIADLLADEAANPPRDAPHR